MELIQNNPYRIAGILSNATERELQKQKTKIKAYTKVGKEIKSDFDFQILGSIDRTEDSVNKAFSNVEQNQDKVNYALFWFLNASPFDNTAFEYLKNGDEEKALEIWEKVTTDKDVNSKNFSAFNNLGTYKLLSRDKSDIKTGIEAKIKLIESDYFESFVHSVADETYTIDNQKQSEKLIDELLTQFKNQYSSSETLQLFSGCNGTSQKYLSKKFTEEPLHKIESQIESCKKKRKADKGRAYEFGLKLFTNTKDDLSLLKSLLGTSDLKYKAVADQLANEIMQCGIDYFNESQENDSSENYLESSQKLTKLADSIAVGRLTKDRAKDSLATLEEMKDGEVNKAIAILSSIKMAYDKAISEIEAQVSAMRMTMSYNQSINYSKVDKMKANCLNWDKVVEVVGNGISINDVEAIQRCSNQSKVAEYKSLVDFLLGKLGPIQINQVKHLCYWKDVRAAQAKSTAKKVGSTISSASDGCYIATMAYGDYDHPQVLELRKFRDDFLSRTMLGRSFIKFYYRYSPSLVQRLKNKQGINFIIRKGLDQFIKTIRK
ncbi:CFI-box-CTERM domain-containing protein [Myroides odoratimimus]|uniref:CFI-box-CTERM domain-containing protein n=1 Tax=Myroides odoratimimus TaxID=76832 RepID=UPI0026E0413B|nr:CFI-box-CTERM domain-containing protein [Myroides odoratimimus]MDO5857756.1 CFI-box-CTERM domain-containing protein [Myroides odoratimimus]